MEGMEVNGRNMIIQLIISQMIFSTSLMPIVLMTTPMAFILQVLSLIMKAGFYFYVHPWSSLLKDSNLCNKFCMCGSLEKDAGGHSEDSDSEDSEGIPFF